MEEKKKNEPKVRIHAIDVCEQMDHINFEYASVNFEDLNYYVWGCQEFAPTLNEKEGSFIKDAAIHASERLFSNRDNKNIQTKRKRIKVTKREHTEEELEKLTDSKIQELLGIIDINLVRDQLNNQLSIDEEKSDEEEKYITGLLHSPWRTTGESANMQGKN